MGPEKDKIEDAQIKKVEPETKLCVKPFVNQIKFIEISMLHKFDLSEKALQSL